MYTHQFEAQWENNPKKRCPYSSHVTLMYLDHESLADGSRDLLFVGDWVETCSSRKKQDYNLAFSETCGKTSQTELYLLAYIGYHSSSEMAIVGVELLAQWQFRWYNWAWFCGYNDITNVKLTNWGASQKKPEPRHHWALLGHPELQSQSQAHEFAELINVNHGFCLTITNDDLVCWLMLAPVSISEAPNHQFFHTQASLQKCCRGQ